MSVARDTLSRVYVLVERSWLDEMTFWGYMDITMRSHLVEVSPDMYDPYHTKDEDPSDKGTKSPSVPLLIKNAVADEERTKDLSRPVHEIVQSTRTNGKDCPVVIVEFCSHYESVSDNRKDSMNKG